ncbi:MAG: 50S ribosomal protein L24 [Methyloprofundus sp.]|nr:50S ribosomal protein L24 [Methyloprofundus sp.]
MQKLKQGDEVIVLIGKDKGKRGRISQFLNEKILVEGVNRVKKHQKPNPNAGIQGGIIEKEMPIHKSNVALYNAATKKADKVGFKALDDGKKVRYFKSNNEIIDV